MLFRYNVPNIGMAAQGAVIKIHGIGMFGWHPQ